MDEELAHGRVRVVLIQDTEKRTTIQELHEMEAPAEDPVGGSVGGDGGWKSRFKIRGLLADERHPIDLGFFAHHEGGTQSRSTGGTAEAGGRSKGRRARGDRKQGGRRGQRRE